MRIATKAPLRILHLEDDPKDAELIHATLEAAGFAPEIVVVQTKADYLAQLEDGWDLVLADYKLPQFDGLQALALFKERGLDTSFILISGTIGEETAVAAMHAGASDYILKNQLARLGPAVERGLRETVARRARKQAEAALIGSEERLAAIVESAMDAIITVDEAHRILVFNAAAAEMFGCAAAAAIGQPIEQFMPPGARAGHAMSMRAFAAEPQASRGMARRRAVTASDSMSERRALEAIRPVMARRADGREFPVEASISHLQVQRAQLFSVILRDISERVAAEAMQASLETQVRESQKMEAMGILASGVAHDFNNIIATILGNTMLAKQDVRARPADVLVSLEEIDKAATRAKNLVHQILTFSRKGVQTLVVQPLRPLVEEAMSLLRSTLPAAVEFAVDLAETPLHAAVDATQIEQVLINLCTNAGHAMKNSAGRIEIGLAEVLLDQSAAQPIPDLHPGRYVRLSVRDNGSGMDEATQARIFEPFFTTKEVGSGTGLGLSVVHGIVKTHAGAITMESAPGMGTRVDVYLPAAAAPLEAVPLAKALPTPVDRQGRHVLYVDDEESLLLLVARMLKRLNYRVSTAAHGAAALAAVRANPGDFDLVVTDFNMPGLSGLQLAQELQRMRPQLPVVISSGFIDAALTTGARAAGVREVFYKQNTVEALCSKIHQLLETDGA